MHIRQRIHLRQKRVGYYYAYAVFAVSTYILIVKIKHVRGEICALLVVAWKGATSVNIKTRSAIGAIFYCLMNMVRDLASLVNGKARI